MPYEATHTYSTHTWKKTDIRTGIEIVWPHTIS
jgi:hypothetical protein